MSGKRGIKKIFCLKCGKLVNPKDHQVAVITYNHYKLLEDKHWHFICWVDYFNDCVTKRAKAQLHQVQLRAIQVFHSPLMRGLLNQIQGGEQLLAMLETPLTTKTVQLKTKIAQKIEHDRKKRGKHRKAKMSKV